MLLPRVLTALVLLAVLVPAMVTNHWWAWPMVTLVLLAVAAYEWGRLLSLAGAKSGRRYQSAQPVLLGLGVVAASLAYLYLRATTGFVPGDASWLWAGVTVLWFAGGLWRLSRPEASSGGYSVAFFGLLACWVALFELHKFGVAWLLSSLAIVWVADIGAYFVGRQFGRRKLAPRVSPGKSWEGAIGGWILVLIMAWSLAAAPGFALTLNAQAVALWSPLGAGLVMSVLVVLSIIGDLFESLLKRQAGEKDSGWILPGHGGVLDRIDALIPAMPAALAASLWLAA
jgi:phosphatidate cytidylyltransferase